MITVAILLPVDNRRYFTIGAILDNRLVLTINRTKLLDYRKNDFHLLCSLVVVGFGFTDTDSDLRELMNPTPNPNPINILNP